MLVTSTIDWLEEKKERYNLHSIIKIESTRIIREKETKEIRYYITDLEANAQKLLFAIRSHWTLDRTFREDESRIRKMNASENMSIIRHIVLNLLRKADEKISIRRRKK